jgi:hypothetical protein
MHDEKIREKVLSGGDIRTCIAASKKSQGVGTFWRWIRRTWDKADLGRWLEDRKREIFFFLFF